MKQENIVEMDMQALHSLYLYESPNGELVRVIRDLDAGYARARALQFHLVVGYTVKIVDQDNGVVVETL